MNWSTMMRTVFGFGTLAGLAACTAATGEGGETADEHAIQGTLADKIRAETDRVEREEKARLKALEAASKAELAAAVYEAYGKLTKEELPNRFVDLNSCSPPPPQPSFYWRLRGNGDERVLKALEAAGYRDFVIVDERGSSGSKTLIFRATPIRKDRTCTEENADVVMTCYGVGTDRGPTKAQCGIAR
jgi:hypothetical protein